MGTEKKNSPGVILKSKFVFSDKKFSEYIEYIDRSEAVRSNAYFLYSVYTDYMDNPEKQRNSGLNTKSDRAAALFTATKDSLTADDKQELKQQFIKAQKAGSPMWQNVISFTNEFLERNGMYESSTSLLDEAKIRTVTRLAMEEMLKDEKMAGAAIWSASIHYNTDNIHVHIAVVEPTPTRKKKEYKYEKEDGTTETKVQFQGALGKKAFGRMKSKIVNNIVDRSPELTQINDIIRKNIVAEKRQRIASRDENLRGAFLNLYRMMPKDRHLWQYSMNALLPVRSQIDQFTKLYIDLYHKEDFAELTCRLEDQEKFLKSVYGEGKQELYKRYAVTKTKDLYTRMGNAVLRELREYDRVVRGELSLRHKKMPSKQKLKEKGALVRKRSATISNLKKAFHKDFTETKNLMEFERLQQEIEQENDRQV